jgi:hypothetical protein
VLTVISHIFLQGRPNLGMELEETSSLIPAFLKRYKYENFPS